MLYGHGDDFYNAKNEVKINFSSNVWHGANLDKLKEHLIEHFDKLTRYPEPDAATLKRLLARRMDQDIFTCLDSDSIYRPRYDILVHFLRNLRRSDQITDTQAGDW